jgi:hypothetical protein
VQSTHLKVPFCCCRGKYNAEENWLKKIVAKKERRKKDDMVRSTNENGMRERNLQFIFEPVVSLEVCAALAIDILPKRTP